MRLLAIDTSGPALSLALFKDSALLSEFHTIIGRGHAEQIIPAVAGLAGGGRAEIIIVGCGPGSFTGIRSGVAAARALGFGWGSQVFGMSSLALIAAGVESNQKELLVAIEGGHGALFVQSFAQPSLLPMTSIQSLTPDEAGAAHNQYIVAGNGAERLVAARGFGEGVDCAARASHAMLLPEELRNWPPSPVYGRAPDAKAAA